MFYVGAAPGTVPTDGNTPLIEYALIFALGFFAASLIVLVISPTIRRRIVTLTERRMRATVALTSNEVRAERDAEGARRAMEAARLSVNLDAEKQRRVAMMTEGERLKSSLRSLGDTRLELERQVEQLVAEGTALRSRIGEAENRLADKTAALAAAEALAETKDSHIESLTGRAEHLSTALDSARADLASRDAQADRLQAEIAKLRESRAAQRDAVNRAAEEASALGIRLERERERAGHLDEKLAASVAERIDRESEAERLRADLSKASEDAMEMRRMFDDAMAERDRLRAQLESLRDVASSGGSSERSGDAMPRSKKENASIRKRVERLRRRHNSLVNHLIEARDDTDNDHLRDEITEIAAMMIDLTAAREGPGSPINGILAGAEQNGKNGSDAPSLAERSRRYIEDARHE